MGNTTWRSEPTDVEKSVDELRLGVKCQSNQELAGSPRNAFRHSGLCGRRNDVPNNVKLRIPVMSLSSSEAMSDKIHGQEGNSPERQLRSLIYAKWLRR